MICREGQAQLRTCSRLAEPCAEALLHQLVQGQDLRAAQGRPQSDHDHQARLRCRPCADPAACPARRIASQPPDQPPGCIEGHDHQGVVGDFDMPGENLHRQNHRAERHVGGGTSRPRFLTTISTQVRSSGSHAAAAMTIVKLTLTMKNPAKAYAIAARAPASGRRPSDAHEACTCRPRRGRSGAT